jgi:hypothetical protein
MVVDGGWGVTGNGQTEAEIRYLLTSCGDDPAVLVQATQGQKARPRKSAR